jgi:DNA-binding IclR family transcriptional regulator
MKPVTTVTKVCRIIDELARAEALGVSELSRRTALLPSDIHRLLAALRETGYVEQDPDTKKYEMGVHVLRIGLEACQQNHLYESAHPELVDLARRIRARVHLGAFDASRTKVFLVDDIPGAEDDPSKARLGGVEPFHCSALGKVVAASIETRALRQALEKTGMPRGTLRTITDPELLGRHLVDVRGQGYAVDREECFDGLCCLGVAVRDADGEVVGSISTSMSAIRFKARNEFVLAEELCAASARISTALGKSRRAGPDWRRRLRD